MDKVPEAQIDSARQGPVGTTQTKGEKMKRYLSFLAAILVLGFLAIIGCSKLFAAQGPPVLDSPRLRSFNATALYNPDGGLTSLNVVITYEVMMLLPDGKSSRAHLKTETADLIVNAGQQVVIGDQLVEFADLAEDIMAVKDFVWFLNNPRQLSPDRPPAPVPQAAEKRIVAEQLLREAEALEAAKKTPVERRKKVPVEKRKAMREPSP